MLSETERNRAVIERVQQRITDVRNVENGMLERQGMWASWRQHVLATDLSWHSMFKMGDSMIGFMLSAVYGTLLTPALVSKWSEDEDGMCKLCTISSGTIQHILSGCKVALGQGRYRWRHDKVLRQIAEQVQYHCNTRANNPKRSTKRDKGIAFVTEGERVKPMKKRRNGDMGLLTDDKDWVVMSDLGKQLKFPACIVETTLRPDLVIYSPSVRRVIW